MMVKGEIPNKVTSSQSNRHKKNTKYNIIYFNELCLHLFIPKIDLRIEKKKEKLNTLR